MIELKFFKEKHDSAIYTLRKVLVKSFLGKTVNIKIDRPLGSAHPKYPDTIYPVNYGYIPDVPGGDVEDKLVAAPEKVTFTEDEIAEAVHFQEQYYETEIEIYPCSGE